MICEFCKKEIGNELHICKEKKSFYKKYKAEIIKNKDLIIELHTKKGEEMSSTAIFNYLLNNNYFNSMSDNDKDILSKLKKYSGNGNHFQIIRSLLKKERVLKMSTASKTQNMIKTIKEKYGVENVGQLPENRKKLSDRNNAEVFKLPVFLRFDEYNQKVALITRRNRKKLSKPITDYYTGLPFLKEMSESEFMQGDLYPTVDHKLSVFYCFLKNIPAEECASISNLCWTYRFINTKKFFLTESMFINTLLPSIKEILSNEISNLIRKGYTPCK